MLELNKVHHGYCPDALKQLDDNSIHCCITSPPYYNLRRYSGVEDQIWGGKADCAHEWESCGKSDQRIRNTGREDTHMLNPDQGYYCTKCYAWKGCLGLEPDPNLYVEHLTQIFSEVHRAMHPSGTCWVVIGDSYTGKQGNKPADGLKPKDLLGVPWRLAFSMQRDGWWLRQDIIWAKPSSMPSPVNDRCTSSHEYIFMFAKSQTYYYDHFAIADLDPDTNRRANKRDVWTVSTYKDTDESHFAVYPVKLIEPMILAGTSEHGCCPKCLAPYERKLVNINPVARTTGRTKFQEGTNAEEGRISIQRPVKLQQSDLAIWETSGWEQTCKCNAGSPIKCRVLDPFSGSGTTVFASIALNRDAIGFDASKDYVEDIAKYRVEEAKTGLTKQEQKKGQLTLGF